MKKAVVSVINDLVTDQRVHKTCTTLHEMGYEVLLVGRIQKHSLPLQARSYHTHRMKLMAEKGMLFYLLFQWRLFWFLMKHKADVYVANDLDTLWPNHIVSRLRSRPLVYDTHEIFTEVPELIHRPLKQKMWRMLEQHIFPRLRHVFTVNESIAAWYETRYGVRPVVVRNMPRLYVPPPPALTRTQAGLPENKAVVLMQGAGLNIQRGAEEAVLAMKYMDDAVLLIIGGGDVLPVLKQLVKENGLEENVIFTGKLPPDELRARTRLADIGLTLDKDTNLNYRYSLPNKIFDYIHAGVPVLASDLPEVKHIVTHYNVGQVVTTHAPEEIARALKEMLNSPRRNAWKANALEAAKALCWETEEDAIKRVYARFLQ
ncbi:MAG: glycosyltransferase [Bacteroidetes bacterium]|nr:glycosyltransferase [Bacteroidota bacterium]